MKGSPLSPPAKRIVCLGDSLTLAIGSAELDKWPVRVALELEKEFPERYALFIRAWNGATTFDVLQRMTAEAFYLMPATVLATLGVNDAHVPSHRRNHPTSGKFLAWSQKPAEIRSLWRSMFRCRARAIFPGTARPTQKTTPLIARLFWKRLENLAAR